MSNSLSTNQINAIGKLIDPVHFAGCFPNDGLKDRDPRSFGWYVLNLQNSNFGGLHWIFLSDHLPHTSYYSDSFGSPPTQLVSNFLAKTNKICYFNDGTDLQAFSSSRCGWFSLYFGAAMSRCKTDAEGKAMFTTLIHQIFSKSVRQNERMIEEFEQSARKRWPKVCKEIEL